MSAVLRPCRPRGKSSCSSRFLPLARPSPGCCSHWRVNQQMKYQTNPSLPAALPSTYTKSFINRENALGNPTNESFTFAGFLKHEYQPCWQKSYFKCGAWGREIEQGRSKGIQQHMLILTEIYQSCGISEIREIPHVLMWHVIYGGKHQERQRLPIFKHHRAKIIIIFLIQ